MTRWLMPLTVFLTITGGACEDGPAAPAGAPAASQPETAAGGTPAGGDARAPGVSSGRIQPADLRYLGAFRLPDRAADAPDAESWEYGGQALAYRPDGDREGSADGYPGSLFGTGHDVHDWVSEIGIPAPSLSRNVDELAVATTIQGFHDVRGGLFDALNEMPRVGLAYVPAEADRASGRLYMAWGQHFQEEGTPTVVPSHACCDVDLSHPNTRGAWWLGQECVYSTNDYMFNIPPEWARRHVDGMTLACGRFRDGGWSGMGPSLFVFAPLDDKTPAPGARLDSHRLLLYSHTRGDDATQFRMNGYQHSDEWEGGAWLTAASGRSAVVFVGTKGSGYLWYGFFSPAGDGMPCVEQGLTMVGCFNPDGTECAAELQGECPGHVAASRGWWSSRFDARIIFYDPADFAAVAEGGKPAHEPQPYATLDIDEHLFLNATTDTESIGTGDQRRYRVGEPAYDRERGLLYIPERFADGPKPVIHVWRVQ